MNRPRRALTALLVTQSMSAFLDNALKIVLAFAWLRATNDETAQSQIPALMQIVFMLPFVLFSIPAGRLADAWPKARLVQIAMLLQTLVVIIIGGCLQSGELTTAALCMILLGIKSALFTPVKYGIIPELVPTSQISYANGYLEFTTFIAILSGTAAGGALGSLLSHPTLVASLCITLSLIAVASSFFLQRLPAADPSAKVLVNPLPLFRDTLTEICAQSGIFFAVLGIVYFWLLGSFFQLNNLVFAKNILHLNEIGSAILIAMLGVGIGVGSLLAGRFSRGNLDLGLAPIGSFGIAIFSLMLALLPPSPYLSNIIMLGLGISGGMFIVPIDSYLQHRAPPQRRGVYLGVTNLMVYLGMISAAVLFFVLRTLELPTNLLFGIVGVFSLFATALVLYLLPEVFLRCVNWIFTHTFYRLRISGVDSIPTTGGALLVCNHVSYMDPLLLLAAVDRPIRFVMFRGIYEKALIHPIVKTLGVIPISENDGPKALLRSLTQAREAIKSGELVCIFAEGSLTRLGTLLPFQSGFERIMKGVSEPIIPCVIDEIWGSIFSHRDGKVFWKFPRELPRRTTLRFGAPVPSSITTFQLRQTIQEMIADAARARQRKDSSLAAAFLRAAKRRPFRPIMCDSSGKKIGYLSAAVSAHQMQIGLTSQIRDLEMVGVDLPASLGSALVNLALTFRGAIPVNLNSTASREAITSAVAQCSMKHVITSRAMESKLPADLPVSRIYIEDLSASSLAVCVQNYLEFLLLPRALIRQQWKIAEALPTDCATVLFSSGSTGTPKGVMLSHLNILSNIESLYDVFQLRSDDCILGILPLFHSFGYTATLWLPLLSGTRVAFHPNPLDFGAIGKLCANQRGTLLMSTPTFLLGYLRKVKPEEFTSLRHVVVGAEKLKPTLSESFRNRFGITPMEGYGCTELSPVALLNLPDVHDGEVHQRGNKSGSAGLPIPGVAVRVVDIETHTPIGQPDTAGLLAIKGSNVMLGYLGAPLKTSEVILDGWYLTGDIATIDKEGFVCITDRLSRFSKIGGEMVPHLKIEEEIHAILGSNEPTCVVTAVPDEKRGERLIVLSTTLLDGAILSKELAQRGMPNLWIPKREDYFKVETFPLLGTGKLDLKAIKDLAIRLSDTGKAEYV